MAKIISLQQNIQSFEKDCDKIKKKYTTRSLPEILNVGRKEMSHSAFIAWLLDLNETHELGDFPLKNFFEILVKRDKQQGLSRHNNCQKYSPQGLLNPTFENIKLTVERTTDKKDNGRVDIVVEGEINGEKFGIIIENKVYSTEQNKQTETYFNTYKDKYDRCFFVYLTPLSAHEIDSLQEPECACKEFIQINYQDILDKILLPAALNDHISHRTKIIIKEYINCLCYMSNNKPMATQAKDQESLIKLWKNHQDTIIRMLEAISDDDNQPSTLRDKIKKSANELREIGKVKYNFNGKQNIGHRELVKEVFKELVNGSNDPKVINNLNNLFHVPNIEKNPVEFVYEESDFNKLGLKPRNCNRFTKVTIATNTYYLYGEWTPDKIDNLFLKRLETNFETIHKKIEKVL